MRNIAAASYPVGQSLFQVLSKWMLLLFTVVVLLEWWIHSPGTTWIQIAGLMLWVVPAIFILRESFWPVSGMLRWTGSEWTWECKGQILGGTLTPRLDFQTSLLLEFKAAGHRSTWLWISSEPNASLWVSLRQAIWSIQKADGQSIDRLAAPP